MYIPEKENVDEISGGGRAVYILRLLNNTYIIEIADCREIVFYADYCIHVHLT